MSLLLVSHPLCPYVHRATAMLLEKGVPFETRYTDLKVKPDWFLAISPRGKVPVLVADGVALFESAAILEYLDETNPPHVVPTNAIERARQRAWIEVANDVFMAHYKLAYAATPDQVAPARAAVDEVLARFEAARRGTFFAGDQMGLVDFAVAPGLFRLHVLERCTGVAILSASPIAAYAERLVTRPSVVNGVPPDFEATYRAGLEERGVFALAA